MTQPSSPHMHCAFDGQGFITQMSAYKDDAAEIVRRVHLFPRLVEELEFFVNSMQYFPAQSRHKGHEQDLRQLLKEARGE